MNRFQPSTQESYGLWPFSNDGLEEDVMYYAAQTGAGIGPEVYTAIPDRMNRAPKDQIEAYAQASYFVALAARRAAQLEDEGTLAPGAKAFLQARLAELAQESKLAQADTNFVCANTGYWCPVRGAGTVLRDTIQVIEDSGLPDQERVRMTTILRKSRTAVLLKQAVPWLILAGAVGTLGAYLYTRSTPNED